MNSKAKLSLTITAMVMAGLIAIVSIIAVFAARTQNFQSSVSVRYKASQIVGKVSANYYIGYYDYDGTSMETDSGETELVFDTYTTLEDSLNPTSNIELTWDDEDPDNARCVVFEYIFQNGLGDPISTDYMATLTFSGTAKNINITTVQSYSQLDADWFYNITTPVDTPEDFTISVPVVHEEGGDNTSTKYFYVKAEIDSELLDSEFSGNFVWDLENWDAPQIDEIYNTNSKSFNKENLDKLLQTISGDSSASTSNLTKIKQMATSKTTAKQMRESAGDDISITLGGLKWTATYLSTDNDGNPILTLWLEGFQDAWAGNSSTAGEYYGFLNGGLYSDWSANWYESGSQTKTYPSNMYGTSYIRSVVLNNGGTYATSSTASATGSQSADSVFALFTMSDGGLTEYLVKPSEVAWQEQGQSAKDQFAEYFSYNCPNENWSTTLSSDGFYNENFNYAGKTGSDAWKNDYLWLPSLTETGFNEFDALGLWQLSGLQRYNSLEYQAGKVGNTSGDAYNYSWLRSGDLDIADYAYDLDVNGLDFSSSIVNFSLVVRPALHLNLASAALAA